MAKATYSISNQTIWRPALLGFPFFVALYLAPFFLQEGLNIKTNIHAHYLLNEAFKLNLVKYDIAMNVVGHFLLVAVFYLCIVHIARTLHQAFNAKFSQVLIVTTLLVWLFVCFINVSLFPQSAYLPKWSMLTYYLIGICTLLFLLTYLYALIRLNHKRSILFLLVAIGITSIAFQQNGKPPIPEANAASTQRNVIIVGVDSLAPAGFEMMKDQLPNMRALTENATQFSSALTPLARTCPAWFSILSGQLPLEHGAYFNLRELSLVKGQDLLSHDMKGAGYQTIFAIDERRFCNIDEEFGFNHVIGPKAGLLDFLVQRYNDTPLSNMLLQFEVSRIFFSHSYMNVASHNNYNPAAIVKGISTHLGGEQPLFLATHFLAAHYPYHIPKVIPSQFDDNSYLARQSSSLQLVDQQIGLLIDQLKKAGRLDNALVIFLSDHGEAMVGVEEPVVYRDREPGKPVHGHGTNIVSTWQNNVMFAASVYTNGEVQSAKTHSDMPVSLLDVRHFVNHYVKNGDMLTLEANRGCFPVETGLRIFAAMDYEKMNYESILEEGLPYYEVDSKGRMVLKEDRLKELIESKDFGVWCGNKLTFKKSSQPETIYTLLREGYQLREVDLDPIGVAALELHIERYRKITAQLPDSKNVSMRN